MGNDVFNIGKGRVVEYYNRVESNDPTASALIVVLGIGAITDATLIDLDDLAAVIADAGFTEAVFTNYARKTLTDVELAPLPAPVDASDRYDVDIPDQTWTNAGNGANDTLTRLLINYDNDTAVGTDANIIPLCFYDFAITTNGGDLTAQVDAQGFFSAT
jgi:hypothetical protein